MVENFIKMIINNFSKLLLFFNKNYVNYEQLIR